jgi:hypothetical protein
MTEQEARERAICKSYDYDDEFYVYLDPDPDNAGRRTPTQQRSKQDDRPKLPRHI